MHINYVLKYPSKFKCFFLKKKKLYKKCYPTFISSVKKNEYFLILNLKKLDGKLDIFLVYLSFQGLTLDQIQKNDDGHHDDW